MRLIVYSKVQSTPSLGLDEKPQQQMIESETISGAAHGHRSHDGVVARFTTQPPAALINGPLLLQRLLATMLSISIATALARKHAMLWRPSPPIALHRTVGVAVEFPSTGYFNRLFCTQWSIICYDGTHFRRIVACHFVRIS